MLSFTARNVLLGATMLGAIGGTLGCFALLRRQSLLGDALAHAALPGVCIAFLITGSKGSFSLLIGAMVAGLLGAVVILCVVRYSRVKEDSAIGIVLSVFFGLGIVLLTFIQKLPLGNQSGLDKYLFGQAATLMVDDLKWMGVLGAIVFVAVLLFYKEFKILSFDPEFGASIGLPIKRIELLLSVLLVVVVVIGLQTVGVVLIVATLITPAAAARQWTDSLGVMLLLAGGIGAGSGAAGALTSSMIPRLPTGPVIVLAASAVLVLSLLLAPRRGLLWAWVQERTVSGRIRRENLLKDLYRLGEDSEAWRSGVPSAVVMGVRGQTGPELYRSVRPLASAGLLNTRGDVLELTEDGLREAAEIVRRHRLWELYLTRQLELASDHVHRDAEMMEHALTPEAVRDLEERLGYPKVDPHGRPIPAEWTA